MTHQDDLRYMPRLALALGGGGTWGAAHVGVLQVLKERGIHPSLVAGTSAGAVIGAGYAADYDPYELEEMVTRAQWGNFGSITKKPKFGILDTEALARTIELIGGDRMIEDLPVRYCAVATDVKTRGAYAIDRGSVTHALAASIAVPGLFAPATHDGKILADGGLVQNLPIETAFQMGASHVIAVRLTAEWDSLPQFRTGTRVHELEIRDDVTLIHPKISGRSPWIPRDIPGLVAAGRAASESVLADYPVVTPRAGLPT